MITNFTPGTKCLYFPPGHHSAFGRAIKGTVVEVNPHILGKGMVTPRPRKRPIKFLADDAAKPIWVVPELLETEDFLDDAPPITANALYWETTTV